MIDDIVALLEKLRGDGIAVEILQARGKTRVGAWASLEISLDDGHYLSVPRLEFGVARNEAPRCLQVWAAVPIAHRIYARQTYEDLLTVRADSKNQFACTFDIVRTKDGFWPIVLETIVDHGYSEAALVTALRDAIIEIAISRLDAAALVYDEVSKLPIGHG